MMTMLTVVEPHQTKFDALVDQANSLYATWREKKDRADETRAQLARVIMEARDNLPAGLKWPEVVKARFNFSKSWANQMVNEARGLSSAAEYRELTRANMKKSRAARREATGTDRPQRDGRPSRTYHALEVKLREEKARRERANKRSEWLSHDLAVSQQVVAGLTEQVERLRNAPAVVRFREMWDKADTLERETIKGIILGK